MESLGADATILRAARDFYPTDPSVPLIIRLVRRRVNERDHTRFGVTGADRIALRRLYDRAIIQFGRVIGKSSGQDPGAVAQLGERNAGSVEVRGSSPLSSTEPEWRNRQTRYVQGGMGNCPWE